MIFSIVLRTWNGKAYKAIRFWFAHKAFTSLCSEQELMKSCWIPPLVLLEQSIINNFIWYCKKTVFIILTKINKQWTIKNAISRFYQWTFVVTWTYGQNWRIYKAFTTQLFSTSTKYNKGHEYQYKVADSIQWIMTIRQWMDVKWPPNFLSNFKMIFCLSFYVFESIHRYLNTKSC